MYGTIFTLKIKPGHEELVGELLKTGTKSTPKDMVAWFVMKPDQDHDWLGVAVFKTKEAHVNNANRPEQHALFLEMMQHLEEEPQWTDGTYVIGEIA